MYAVSVNLRHTIRDFFWRIIHPFKCLPSNLVKMTGESERGIYKEGEKEKHLWYMSTKKSTALDFYYYKYIFISSHFGPNHISTPFPGVSIIYLSVQFIEKGQNSAQAIFVFKKQRWGYTDNLSYFSFLFSFSCRWSFTLYINYTFIKHQKPFLTQ